MSSTASTYLETTDGSCKFYRIEVKGTKTIVSHGKAGSEGETKEESHSSAAAANAHAADVINKVQNRGYEKSNKRKRETEEGPRKATKTTEGRDAKIAAAKKITAPKEAVVPKKAAPKKKPAAAKKVSKIAVAKKAATAKKTASKKKATTKKATAKKVTTAKKATTKKVTTAKKATTKKATPKKATTTKKATTKKATTAKKATTKKAPAAKKATTKKETTKKATTKKPATKKSPKKAAPKKATGRPKKTTTTTESPAPAPAPVFVPTPYAPTHSKAPAPTEWDVKLPVLGYGIYVDDTYVYVGDESGLVQQFDKAGGLQKQYRLPTGVKCIVGDGIFLYVGGNDGSLYDITTGAPRLMSKISGFSEVYWMDVRNGQICASDKNNKVALINSEGEIIWEKSEQNAFSGWMCLMDETGVYHGNTKGVQKRDLATGAPLWSQSAISAVLFGQQDKDYVYVSTYNQSHKIDKKTGKIVTTFNAGGPSIGVSKDSKKIAVSNPFTVFDADGNVLHSFAVEASVSMATYGPNEFYGIREDIRKLDLSPEAVEKAKSGGWKTQSFLGQSIAEIMPETNVATTTDTSGGILCECVKEDGKLRVKVISPGYNNSWNVQFPRAIREDGAKYVVEKIVDQGGFYRAWGDIKRLSS